MIKEFLKDINNTNGWDITNEALLETLTEYGTEVSKEFSYGSRHWDIYEFVTEIEGRYFRYEYAHATGDEHPKYLGWEFDWNKVREVIPVQKVVTIIEYADKIN
jgi:hypothetical protein